MKNIFDAMGDFFQDHRLFGEKNRRQTSNLDRRQRKVLQLVIEVNNDQRKRYEKHKDKPKSIFNPRNTERIVHYKTERFYLLDRDNRSCGYCNASGVKLQPDHVIPYSKLPVTHMDNLVMSCEDCNYGKSDVLLSKPTLRDVLEAIKSKNDAYFPFRKYKKYRRNYSKLIR